MQLIFDPEKAAEAAEEAAVAGGNEEPKTEATEEAEAEEGSERKAGPDAAVLDASPDDLWRKSVKVASAGNLPATPTTRSPEADASNQADTTADNLVESYVEAAAQLSDLLEVSHEKHKATQNRLEELSAPIDAARRLLSGEPAEQVLEQVLERIGKGLGTHVCSLSLVRPDGDLSTVVLRNMEIEPIFELVGENGQSVPASIMAKEEPVVFVSGETGPLQEALDRFGDGATALVAIPVRTPVRALGLACFYLPQESAAPGESGIPHLLRIGQGLALALEIASVDIAAERLQRMEKAALVGHITERVIAEIGLPIDQLLTSVGNTIAQIPRGSGTSSQLLSELLTVSKDLVKTQELRESVLGFLSGKLPEEGTASVEDIFERLRSEYAEPLERTGIALEIDREPGAELVAADAFLLRGALLALMEHLRNYLAGCEGGQIRFSAKPVDSTKVRITVSDNTGVVRTSGGASALPDYLAWSLDRRVTGFGLTLAQLVVQHYQGEWQMSVGTERGNEIALTFPVGAQKPSEKQPTPQPTS
jgi:signal transduction histidine kinase